MRKSVKTIATSQNLSFRQVVAAVLLVFFTIANYAVQTHVHQSYLADGTSKVTSVASLPSGAPGDNDQANCPLCQEYVAGGSFLAPLPAIVLPPALHSLHPSLRLPRH